MQPPYSHTHDLEPPMSRLALHSRWTPDPSPPSSWKPTEAINFPSTASPPTQHSRISQDHYPTRLSPSSESSLTDRDISRRTLAASGLDVSAPEFIPSFATSTAHSPPPFDNPQHFPTNHYDPAQTPSPQPFDPSLSSSSLYDHSPPHDSPFYHHDHPHPQHISNLTTYFQDDPSYPPNNPLNSSSFFSESPSSVTASRPAHLDEATYVTAVQHFDEEFPALGKPHLQNPPTATPPINPTWTAHPSPSPKRKTHPEHVHAMFPKALGWNTLQKEQAQRQREEKVAREWQAALDQYVAELDPDDCDDPDEARVSNDVGALWVSTGKSVGQLYQSLRAEAAEEARLRNRYFDRAAAAFKRNDGATAKRLGALGREANERMKELHRRAADAIFEARNPQNVNDVVDLHGLHVSEALERLPIAIQKAPPGTLRILTGTGHHTKGTGRARLRPAVKKWLQDNGYFFEEVVDANEYVGSFKVDIGT